MSRLILKDILESHFSIKMCSFRKNSENKPMIEDSNLNVSLSHSRDLFVFAFSHRCYRIGVDIEAKKSFRCLTNNLDPYFQDGEKQWINSFPKNKKPVALRQIWCMKEAYYKALPINKDLKEMSSMEIDMMSLTYKGKTAQRGLFVNSQFEEADWSFFYTGTKPSLELYRLDGKSLKKKNIKTLQIVEVEYRGN